MIENVEIVVNCIMLIFTVIISTALILDLLYAKNDHIKFKTKTKISQKDNLMYLSVDDEYVKEELTKAIKAIDDEVILNEKQINHADNHNDVKEVEDFIRFVDNNSLNINEIGETIYGEY